MLTASINDLTGKYGAHEPYIPDPEEASFIVQAYTDYIRCRSIKSTPQDILGGITLQEFWDTCNYDYNVIVEPQDENDPVTPYSSTITRDKANAFITNLTMQLLYPSVVAQNDSQEIDRVMGKVSRAILEWQHNNDGRPSMSGQQKSVMYTHKQVIEGTVHVLDNVIDGKLESQLVPNEEIFIPNFLQPDIQKQPYLFRAQMNVLYDEAYRIFGHLPRFKHVVPGQIGQWIVDQDSNYAEEFETLILQDRVHIVWIWYDIPKSKFEHFGIPKSRGTAKTFNIMINGVLMFKWDNVSPYHDGLYPISKGIFEMFSDPRYYWGNSMPGKAKHDKAWLDGWKTLIRYKAKLGALKPIITFNGKFLDADFYIPGSSTVAPDGMKPDDIMAIPEISEGVTQSDLNILEKAEQELNLGNLSPQTMGVQDSGNQTATQSNIEEVNAQKILGAFGQQLAFFVESRTYPILKRSFQMIPKAKLSKIVVGDQSLGNGEMGAYEILFQKMPDMTTEEKIEASFDIAKEESVARTSGRPKRKVYVDLAYLNELDLYVTAIADPMPKKTATYRISQAIQKYQMYRSDPENFNAKPAARQVVREFGDDESEIINDQQAMPATNNPAQATGVGMKPTEPKTPSGTPVLNM